MQGVQNSMGPPNPGMHPNYAPSYGGHMGNGYGTNGQQPIYMSRDQMPMNGYNGNYGPNYSAMPRGHGARKYFKSISLFTY